MRTCDLEAFTTLSVKSSLNKLLTVFLRNETYSNKINVLQDFNIRNIFLPQANDPINNITICYSPTTP